MLYLFLFIYFSYFCRDCRWCACRKHRSRRSCAEVHESGRPFLVTPGHQTGTLQKNWQHYEENDPESVEVRVYAIMLSMNCRHFIHLSYIILLFITIVYRKTTSFVKQFCNRTNLFIAMFNAMLQVRNM